MKATWKKRQLQVTTAFLLALVFGGEVIPDLTNKNVPGEMTDFDAADLQVVIDEGRRQLDSTSARFQHVQGRSQILLTVALAVLAFSAGAISRLHGVHGVRLAAAIPTLVLALALVLTGLGLSAAVIVVRADFHQVDTTQISKLPRIDLLRRLAADYADSVRLGEITVASRVTAFRLATRYTLWGALLTAGAYVAAG